MIQFAGIRFLDLKKQVAILRKISSGETDGSFSQML